MIYYYTSERPACKEIRGGWWRKGEKKKGNMSVFSYLELVILFEVEKKFDGVKKKKLAKRIILPESLPNSTCFAWGGRKIKRWGRKTNKKKQQTPAFFLFQWNIYVWATLQIIVHSMHACLNQILAGFLLRSDFLKLFLSSSWLRVPGISGSAENCHASYCTEPSDYRASETL